MWVSWDDDSQLNLNGKIWNIRVPKLDIQISFYLRWRSGMYLFKQRDVEKFMFLEHDRIPWWVKSTWKCLDGANRNSTTKWRFHWGHERNVNGIPLWKTIKILFYIIDLVYIYIYICGYIYILCGYTWTMISWMLGYGQINSSCAWDSAQVHLWSWIKKLQGAVPVRKREVGANNTSTIE